MDRPAAAAVGIGLKHQHLAGLLGGPPVDIDFVEIHAENFIGSGGPLLRRLQQVRERHALSVHGVGLSIGGEAPPDRGHLRLLRALIERVEPRWFSEHLAWSSHGGHCFHDLLPLPYTDAVLQRVCDHIDQVQAALRRPLLLENPSTYLRFASATWRECDFLAEVVRRTGCGLLLDLNNVHVSATNHGENAVAFIDALPAQAVQELHLAGFAEDTLPTPQGPRRLLIDSHGSPVDEAVWALHAHARQRLGPVPTLIERDQDIPPLPVLLAEARRARHAAAPSPAPRPAGVAS